MSEIINAPINNKEEINNKAKKIFSIIGNILLYILFGLGLIALIFTIIGKRNGDDGVSMFNHQYMTILTGSMEECDETDVSGYDIKSLPVNSLICIENVPEDETQANQWYSEIKPGDVLTFKYVYFEQITITHRVIEIEKTETRGYRIALRGDNVNDTNAAGIQEIYTGDEGSFNYVLGKVVWSSYALGAMFTAFKSPIGMAFIIIVPCAIIFLYELGKIIALFVKEKHQKLEKASANKDLEIEELKRRLEAIENKEKKNDKE